MNIPIFLASDNNYAPFVATTMASILANTESEIDFYILDSGITKENQAKIEALKNNFNNFSVEFLKIDLDKYFNDLNHNWITKSTYSRFLIPHIKPEIEKLIYLDVDIVNLSDISKLYNEDLETFALGAIFETVHEKTANIERKNRLKLNENHKYFNAGVLLIDNKKWAEDETAKGLLNLREQIKNSLTAEDQDVLNKFFDNNYKVLDNKFNFINQNVGVLDSKNLAIRHFNGPIKPWRLHPDLDENKKLSFMANFKEFWKYARLTPFYDELIEKTTYKTKSDIQKFIVYNLMRERANAGK